MKYKTTSNPSVSISFRDALFQSLGKDSSLIVPRSFPRIDAQNLKGTTLFDIGVSVLLPFLEDDVHRDRLRELLCRSLYFPMPLKKIEDTYILELFHGPTFAFKDVAAQFLGNLMAYLLKDSDKHITIVTATSGDTGGAVASGFADKKNIRVVILYPKNGVSKVQREQLTHVAENIYPIEVDGTFDECQTYVKKFFRDERLSRLNLTSANSINIGRLLPQMVYYAYIWSLLNNERIRFVVPSGNMGNITAGLYAKRIGIPIDSFHIACNANDPVIQYLETGEYQPKKSIQTMSSAMDIGNPSNFERILHLYNNDRQALKTAVSASSTNDEETVKTIQKVYTKHNYLLDPHTAVAWCASQKTKSKDVVDIIIATASPAKFAEEIYVRCGIRSDDMPVILSPHLKYKYMSMSNTYDGIVKCIEESLCIRVQGL